MRLAILLFLFILGFAYQAQADVTSSFLLKEDGGKILKEDTGGILLNSMYIPPAANRSALGQARTSATTRSAATQRRERKP